jgi:hypothetical protein
VADLGELPAELSRGDLASWLSCVDVLPLVGDELERRALPADDVPRPGRLQWVLDHEDEDDDDDDLDSDPDEALAAAWLDVTETLGRLVNPARRLTHDQGKALQADAEQAWRDVEPLVSKLEDALAARQRVAAALDALLAGEQGTLRVDRARRRLQTAEALAGDLLTDVIGQGLERRAGLYLRTGGCIDPLDEDWRIFQALRGLGGRVPAGIACCEGCGLVFHPRYGNAAKCDRCHNNHGTPALSFEHPDGGGHVFRSPAFDYRQHVCGRCATLFLTTRSHAKYCDLCKRAQRRESAARSRSR